MNTEEKKEHLLIMYNIAVSAEHIFPFMAACEVALESGFGKSELFTKYNNPFGQKAKKTQSEFPVVILPTTENSDLNNDGTVDTTETHKEEASWIIFPDLLQAFIYRMKTLKRLQDYYPNYFYALTAINAYKYIESVSKTWATDPKRSDKVKAIYNEFVSYFSIDVNTAVSTIVPFIPPFDYIIPIEPKVTMKPNFFENLKNKQ